MFSLKKVLTLCFLALLPFIFCACIKQEKPKDDLSVIMKRGKIIAGVRDDTEPFGFRDKNGNLTGYDIDLAKVIAKTLLGDESKLELVPVTASNRIMKLNSGEVDMLVATMSITPQRQVILNFSEPYYIAGQAILVRSSSNVTNLMEFKHKKLIVVFGSTSEQNIRMNLPEIEIVGCKTYQEAFQALKEGKAEGIIADDTILIKYALKDRSVKLLPKRYTQEPYAIAFRKETPSEKLVDKVDYIIEYLSETGGLEKMKDKWGLD